MILKYVKLENIRSYINQKIEFPTGSILLSGDIGAGKSTVLLSIEFALFGIKKKYLSGRTLLRHGKQEGSVELGFKLDDKEIIIKRFLKKDKKEIKQVNGYIIIDGKKREATPTELKTIIFDLLGYPKEFVMKSRDLIYRYTVYTPQEKMNQILFEDEETRLDTLRRVFNIDKYKRIRENALIIIRDLKRKKEFYEGEISDLDEKKKLEKKYETEINSFNEKLSLILPELNKLKENIKESNLLILKKESEIKQLNELKKELELEELKFNNLLQQIGYAKKDLVKIITEIKNSKKELEGKSLESIGVIVKKRKRMEEELELLNKEFDDLKSCLTKLNSKKDYIQKSKEKIIKLDRCPTCEQQVTQKHKEFISKSVDNQIRDIEEKIKKLKIKIDKLKTKIEELKAKVEDLKKKENTHLIYKLKFEYLTERIRKKDELERKIEEFKKDLGKINIKKLQLRNLIEEKKDIEKEYEELKSKLEKLLSEEKKLELEKTRIESEKESVNKMLKSLKEEIKSKELIKKKIGKIAHIQHWLEEYFINLVSVIEKQVMARVHDEFNVLFKEWFNTLIEDETLTVRIDDIFTPVIEQDGYETTIENLSGGERTSVALSYRLALNKVINDMISEIKTKDLIILDEPTDGFSSEQLDRIRDVLEQLNMKQVIIVSHESKIEGFVDYIIKIVKEGHTSRVIT